MKTTISCPACSGRGQVPALEAPCTYCNGEAKVELIPHLKLIGHGYSIKNVKDFERRAGKHHPKPHR